jgi:hypothetical protein
MDLSESPTGEPPALDPITIDPTPVPRPPAAPIHPGRAWILGLLGAVIAGAIAAGSYEVIPTIYIPPPHMVRVMGQMMNQPFPADVLVADRKNAVVAFGLAGGVFAMLMGVAGGLARGSGRGVLVGAVAGLILGAAAGAAAGPVGVTVYTRAHDADSRAVTVEMKIPMMIHAGLWAAIGAAGAAGLGIGARAWWRMPSIVLSGLVGGAMGGCLYELVSAALWADGRTYQVFAGRWEPRIVAAMAPPVVAAVLAISGLVAPMTRPPRKPVPVPAAEV